MDGRPPSHELSFMIENAVNLLNSAEWDKMSLQEIEEFLPYFGINDEKNHQMPPEFKNAYGKGLRFWQYPNQFAKLVHLLAHKKYNSYLEIGCRWGGTFAIIDSVLRQNNKELKSYAVDIIEQPEVFDYLPEDCHFIQGSSFEEWVWDVIPDKVDVILIDGLHSLDALRNDFKESLRLCPKVIIFHDICSDACPDVVKFWEAIKTFFPDDVIEITDQYDSVDGNFLGIGVLESNWQ